MARSQESQGLGHVLRDDGSQDPKERVDFVKSLLAEGTLLETKFKDFDLSRAVEGDPTYGANAGKVLAKHSLIVQ